LYKTGYDPQAFIDFFEKIQAKEKSRPGTLAKAFSTHPLTPERIDASQEEIQTVLPPRNEYVVTTSEYDGVVERLRVLQSRGAVEAAAEAPGEDRPTLRKTTRTPPSAEGQPSEDKDKGDERPRLERK
ncbi:MAG: peptidase M48, partial [Acidobacteria bacterium]|nr:peptidase M48 [Acidobacteriota bacterium]